MYQLVLFIVLASLIGVSFWRRFGTVFNPPSLTALSLAGASSIAVFFDALVQRGNVIHAGFVGSTTTAAVVYSVGLISFVIPWLDLSRKQKTSTMCADKNLSRTLLQISCLVVTALVLTWALLGEIPFLQMALGRESINDHLDNLRRLTPGVMMANLAALVVLCLYIASRSAYPRTSFSSKLIFAFAILVALVACGWQGNRQSFLIFLFFFIVRNFLSRTERYGHKPDKGKVWRMRIYTAISLFVFAGGFTAINYIRLAHEGRFSGPAELLLYYSWPVYNIVSITSKIGIAGTGDYSFLLTELLPARFGGKALLGEISQLLFEPTSPSGFFSYWYLSFGAIGVAMGGLVFSLASRYAFEVSLRSEHHLRVYILLLFSCATISVYSHFLSLSYFWIPLLSLVVVNFCSRITLLPSIAEPRTHS